MLKEIMTLSNVVSQINALVRIALDDLDTAEQAVAAKYSMTDGPFGLECPDHPAAEQIMSELGSIRAELISMISHADDAKDFASSVCAIDDSL